MEDLQWARILVKSNDDDLPCSLEIGVEEETYNLSLWWEVLPSLRQDSGMKRGSMSRPSGEVRGDAVARVGPLVEELASAGDEVQFQSVDGTEGQAQGVGFNETGPHAQVGSLTQPFVGISEVGLLSSGLVSGLVGSKWAVGPLPSNPSAGEASKVAEALVGGSEIGPLCPMGKGWATVSMDEMPQNA